MLALGCFLAPGPARAHNVISQSDWNKALLPPLLMALAVEGLTIAATIKNALAIHRSEPRSDGWIAVGTVGGVLNAGVGAGLLYIAGKEPEVGVVGGSFIAVGALAVGYALVPSKTSTREASAAPAAATPQSFVLMAPALRF